MERRSQLPEQYDVIKLAGVQYRRQPDGTWVPMPGRQRPAVEARQPVTYAAEPVDVGETAYQRQHIERLRSVVAGADVAREELDRRAAAAAVLLQKHEAELAARAARADRRKQLEEFYAWNPDDTHWGNPDAIDLEAQWPTEAVGWSDAAEPEPLDESPVETKKPKRRKVRRGIAIAALSGVVLSGVGGVVTGYPMKWLTEGRQKTAAAATSQVPLSAAKEQLIDAFGSCFDEQANGSPLAVADIQTTTDVSYEITTADTKKVVLAAADKSTGRTSIKPVVKLTDAKADYMACVAPADRGDVLKVDGNKIEVNESLISPQGHVAIMSYLRGMMLNENDDSTAIDTTGLIAQLVSAKTISAAEGKRVSDAYVADATAKEEVRQAGALTAKELANDADIYAQQAKVRIDTAIKQALNAKVKQLHEQGAISIDSADIVMTGTLSRPITIKNSDPTPAQNMPFTEAGAPRVLNYTFKDGEGK